MNIGNQIRAFRLRKGVTQEAVAQHFHISSQAVSKWETGQSLPDMAMLPELSAYFGVTIDELFALSDETRLERIRNMLSDVRFLNKADVENERQFLLDKSRREPQSDEALCLLAQLELHLAQEHFEQVRQYAGELLKRENATAMGCYYLGKAMGGIHVDPRNNTHNELIDLYRQCLQRDGDRRMTYGHLISQLIDDHRLKQAQKYCDEMEKAYPGDHFTTVHQVKLAISAGDHGKAMQQIRTLDEKYPDDWSIQHWIGDLLTLAEEYKAARRHYRKAIALLPTPRYIDPIDSLAQCCEMDGDPEAAIAARKLQLEVLATDWNCTAGETVDCIRRQIHRLEKSGISPRVDGQ